jgi:hypothetical protein
MENIEIYKHVKSNLKIPYNRGYAKIKNLTDIVVTVQTFKTSKTDRFCHIYVASNIRCLRN